MSLRCVLWNVRAMGEVLRRGVATQVTPGGTMLVFNTHHINGAMVVHGVISGCSNEAVVLGNRSCSALTLLRGHSVTGCQRLLSNVSLLTVSRTRGVPRVNDVLGLVISRVPKVDILTDNSSSFSLLGGANRPLINHDARFLLAPFSRQRVTRARATLRAHRGLRTHLVCNSCPRMMVVRGCRHGASCLHSVINTCLLGSVLTVSNLGGSDGVHSLLQLVTFRLNDRISCRRLNGRLNVDGAAIRGCLSLLRGIFIVCHLKTCSHGLHGRIAGTNG